MRQRTADRRHGADAHASNVPAGFCQQGNVGPHQRGGFNCPLGAEGADPHGAVIVQAAESSETTEADQVRRLDQSLLHQVDQPGPSSDNLRLLTIAGEGRQRLIYIRRFEVGERDHGVTFPSATA